MTAERDAVAALRGRRYLVRGVHVGRDDVRRLARALGIDAGVHIDVDAAVAAGYPDLVTPVTFPVLLQQRPMDLLLAELDSMVDARRIVHGEQSISRVGTLCAGMVADAELEVADVREAGAHLLVATSCDVRVEGVIVARTTSVIVVRGAAQA
jgi:hypothetical protein